MKIIFQFVGGPLDGETVAGQYGGQDDADRYYALTHHGKLGQRFRVASHLAVDTLAVEGLTEESPHHFQRHSYQVVDRTETPDDVHIRADYVDHNTENLAGALSRRHRELPSSSAEPIEQVIGRYLIQAVKAMGRSYSHYWPADAANSGDATRQNMALHFAHVLLSHDFSVFAAANHPSEQRASVDLLGIAPSQDWFLACQFEQISYVTDLDGMLGAIVDLESFWLSTRLTIDACSEHIVRVAKHCERGYGIFAGLHWVAEQAGSSELLDFWQHGKAGEKRDNLFAEKLNMCHAEWPEPMMVRNFAGHGTYYVLSAFFKIAAR